MQNRTVVIGLGSNKDSIINLRKALLCLRQENNFKILKVSRIYESKALLPDSAISVWDLNYLNAAVLVQVGNFEPVELLQTLKNIEKKIGRKSAERWAPREIDLDILHVENFEYKSDFLIIPHAGLYERAFACLPAQEVCPEIRFTGTTDGTWLSEKFFWPEFAAILNVTPDSFSDGGLYLAKDYFLAKSRELLKQGADYLDIGAESTRPGATLVDYVEELKRLTFAFECLNELKLEGFKFKTSLDSRNFEVIQNIADAYQLDLINDVSGFSDARVLNLVNKNSLKAVCMHSLSVPADKSITIDFDSDPIAVLNVWWTEKMKSFKNPENIYFDPGFGFGKTSEQSKYMVDHIHELVSIKQPFFLGYSRKSFLFSQDKDAATATITAKLNLAFAQILRFHDLKLQKAALLGQNEL